MPRERAQGLYLVAAGAGRSGSCRRRWLPAPRAPRRDAALDALRAAYNRALDEIGAEALAALRAWPERERGVTAPEYSYTVRGREVRGANYTESLSHSQIPKLAPPKLAGWGEMLRFPAERESAGRVSLHRRRLSVSARGRRSDAHVRG